MVGSLKRSPNSLRFGCSDPRRSEASSISGLFMSRSFSRGVSSRLSLSAMLVGDTICKYNITNYTVLQLRQECQKQKLLDAAYGINTFGYHSQEALPGIRLA